MASKGQKFRSYSAELKQTILKEYFDGAETTLSQLFSRHLFACHSLFKGSPILSTNIEYVSKAILPTALANLINHDMSHKIFSF